MKTTYKVNRSQIIEALETEALIVGEFFDENTDDGKCGVCAVGAVLRTAGKNKRSRRLFANDDGTNVCEHACAFDENPADGNLLSLLSTEYEKAYEYKFLELKNKRIKTFEMFENKGDDTNYEELLGVVKKQALDAARFHAINIVVGTFPRTLTFEV